LRREGGEEGREEGSHGIKRRRLRSVAVIANFLKRKRKRKRPLPYVHNTWTQFNANLNYIQKNSKNQGK
jgi:hypothetical protein